MSDPSKMKVNMSKDADGEKPRMVKLGDVATVRREIVDPTEVSGDTFYLGLEDIERGGRILRYQTADDAGLTSAKFIFDTSDVLYGKLRPNLGKIASPNVGGICSTDILPITSGENLDKDYLRYYLSQPKMVKFAASRTSGANLPRISPKTLMQISIPLPSLEEQRRIVAVLDRADAIRAKRHQILADFDELKADMFCNVFGFPRDWPRLWPHTTIGELTESVQYGTSAKAGSDGAWPILRMGNITDNGCLDLTDLKYIDLPESDIQKYTVRIGDMLFNRTNSKEKVGKSCVVSVERDLAFAGYLVRVRFRNPLHAPFVSAFLNSSYGVKLRQRMAKAAVNQANINATEMKNICIPSPSDVALREFARRVEAIAAARAKVERALALDDELFAALQSWAFRGAL